MILHPLTSRTRRIALPGFGVGERVPTILGRRLDDAFHYFRNVAAGGDEPIDAVVVGPGGTWAISFGHEAGRFRKRNGHWYRWNRSTESWVPWEAEPIAQARLAGHRLELYLERAGLPSTVEAALLAGRDCEVSWEADQRPGIHIHAEPERLAARIGRDETLSPSQVDRIVALLDPRQPLPRLQPSIHRG